MQTMVSRLQLHCLHCSESNLAQLTCSFLRQWIFCSTRSFSTSAFSLSLPRGESPAVYGREGSSYRIYLRNECLWPKWRRKTARRTERAIPTLLCAAHNKPPAADFMPLRIPHNADLPQDQSSATTLQSHGSYCSTSPTSLLNSEVHRASNQFM